MSTLYESWVLYDEGTYDNAGEDPLWQIFTPETDHFITSVKLLISANSDHSGTLTVEIQSTTDGSSWPTGDALSTGSKIVVGEDYYIQQWASLYGDGSNTGGGFREGENAILTEESFLFQIAGDSFSETPDSYWYFWGIDRGYLSWQIFTPTTSQTITSVDLGLYRRWDSTWAWETITVTPLEVLAGQRYSILVYGSDVDETDPEHPTGTIYIEIKATVTYPIPSGNVLCSGTFDVTSIGEDSDNGFWTEINLSGASLSAGTNYAIVIRSDQDSVGWFYQNDVGPYYNDKLGFSGYAYFGTYIPYFPGYAQSYCFKEYGITGYLLGSNFVDLKTELNESDIWNDIRVMLPSYGYTLELVGDIWYKYPVNLQARATSGESQLKYGRRTKTLNKHVPANYYAQSYCEGELAQRKEPICKTYIKLLGIDATNIVTALTARVATEISYFYVTAGLNATALIDNLTLDIDLDGIPRLTLNLTDKTAYQLADVFWVDTDSIDGDHVLGW